MSDIEILISLNDEYLRCYQDGDADGFKALIHDDFRETTAEGELLDGPAFLAKVDSLKGKMPFKLSADDVSIRIFGDTAIIHAVTMLTSQDGERMHGGRYTDVWQRVDSRWRAIAAQVGRNQ